MWSPASLWDPLNVEHDFSIDVAASAKNAKCARFYTREDNGLEKSWRYERVWCNPPYSNIEAWVAKATREMRHAECELVCMVLPNNRTEQGWWQTYVEPYRDRQPRAGETFALRTTFLPGRIRFKRPGWKPPPKGDRPPFGVVILTWTRIR